MSSPKRRTGSRPATEPERAESRFFLRSTGGPCLVPIDGSETEGSVTVLPGETAELPLHTESDVPRGTLLVHAKQTPGGKVLRKIPIRVTARDGGQSRTATTNWSGIAEFQDLPQRTYDLSEGRIPPTLSITEAFVRARKKTRHQGNRREGDPARPSLAQWSAARWRAGHDLG